MGFSHRVTSTKASFRIRVSLDVARSIQHQLASFFRHPAATTHMNSHEAWFLTNLALGDIRILSPFLLDQEVGGVKETSAFPCTASS
jgi:hypothetical protein